MSAPAQIGIDIGTTYSRVAVYQHGQLQMVANELANILTPSYVAYTENLCLVGDQAKDLTATNGVNSIHGVRRILGRCEDDPFVKGECLNRHYNTVPIDGRPRIQVNYRKKPKTVTPEEAMALLIRNMVEIGDKAEEKNAIITVPSQFNCHQRQAVKNAATIAGIDCELINETTAAALACAYEMKSELKKRQRTLLVYNMGGGFKTADIWAGNDFNMIVTREDFASWTGSLFKKAIDPVNEALHYARMKQSQINEIILAGGATRMPSIKQELMSLFPQRRRNTHLPAKGTKVHHTINDNQKSALFCVYQGEEAKCIKNMYLGEFTLNGLREAPKGEVKFDVLFEVDRNGILNVKVTEQGTKNVGAITITKNAGYLSRQEIAQMIKNEEKNVEDDRVQKLLAQARNALETL